MNISSSIIINSDLSILKFFSLICLILSLEKPICLPNSSNVLGLEPSRDIKESDDWKSIEPYCIKERENATLKYGRL